MSACLHPYPEYRDAGLPWLDTIPTGWTVRRGKGIFNCVDARSATGGEELLTVSSKFGVVPRRTAAVTMFKAESYVGHKLCWPADLVINSLWAWAGGLGFARHHGIVSTAYGVYRLRPELAGYWRYFDYLLRSVAYHWELHVRSKGVWTSRLQMTDQSFLDMPMLLPNPDEADAICRFLDAADQRFNRLIRTKRRLIELLQEQKQAIIHRAVTRGLDPEVRLKPSGIEWLGDIPEHWEVWRSRFLFREMDERSVEGLETHLSMTQSRGLIPSSEVNERRLMSESYAGGKVCQTGDLVLNRLKAHLGVFALAPMQGVISPDYTVLRPIVDLERRYFEAIYRTPACRVELYKRAKGIVQGFWRLYTDDFYGIAVPSPPLQEQQSIMQNLDALLSSQDGIIGRTFREIELIREYRTRLIADVVTGKLDVRGVALPEGDEVGLEDDTADVEEISEDEVDNSDPAGVEE